MRGWGVLPVMAAASIRPARNKTSPGMIFQEPVCRQSHSFVAISCATRGGQRILDSNNKVSNDNVKGAGVKVMVLQRIIGLQVPFRSTELCCVFKQTVLIFWQTFLLH